MLDRLVALILLVLLAPVLAVFALLVRLTIGRPVLFRQVRSGRWGEPFELVKFRSMALPEEDGEADEVRMTPVGRWLRLWSLDELPSLWNVVRGDMGLVGPRPLLPSYDDIYDERQATRLDVKPGLTGWAQINGRNSRGWTEKLELDAWYVEHKSLRLDALILLRTPAAVLLKKGVSHEGYVTMPLLAGENLASAQASRRLSRAVILHVTAIEKSMTHLLLPQLRALRDAGFRVLVACAPEDDKFDDVLLDFEPNSLSFPRKPRPDVMTLALRDYLSLVDRVRPDVVHLHTPAVALPARCVPRSWLPRGTKVVYTVHGFAHKWNTESIKDAVLERVERQLASRTDLMLFQAQRDLAEARKRRYRSRLRYLGNGVGNEWFELCPALRGVGTLRLLYVGRLVREKGVLDLLDAVAKVPEVDLTVAGRALRGDRGDVTREVVARTHQPALAGRIRYIGQVCQAELIAVMAGADALVLPSYREGLPRSVIEAMAAGRPVIVTDIGGCRELVADGVNGLLVPPGNSDALAAALRRMAYLDSTHFEAMGARSRELAHQHHREAAVFGRLFGAYAELGIRPPKA